MFRVRLRVRLGMALTTDDPSRSFQFLGREVTLTSQRKCEPLSKAKWVVLNSRGIPTRAEAEELGGSLRLAMMVAGIATPVGVDLGNDKPSSWIKEDYARGAGLLREEEQLAPNPHGLLILEDDPNLRFFLMEGVGSVTFSPDVLTNLLSSLGLSAQGLSKDACGALTLVNAATVSSDPVGRIALCISAVEALGQNANWSAGQRRLLEDLACTAESYESLSHKERMQVAHKLRQGLHIVGLQEGVRRLMSTLGLDAHAAEWKRVYNLRSDLFHGRRPFQVSEVGELANDALAIARTIVLTFVRTLGVSVP